MIRHVSVYLMAYACLDMTLQIAFQLPLTSFEAAPLARQLGFRKIWTATKQSDFTYAKLSQAKSPADFHGLKCDYTNFFMQMLTCFILATISMQSEIFESTGYKKFFEQTDGSMDLLIKLSVLKQQSMAYVFNNSKIIYILKVQHRREMIIKNLEAIKKKLVRWRLFSKTTLDTTKTSKELEADK